MTDLRTPGVSDVARAASTADCPLPTAHSLATLGPSASEQWRCAPEHLAMVLARYRAAGALIGRASSVLEFGCGEGIGARILGGGDLREAYVGLDNDADIVKLAVQLAGPGRGECVFRFAHADLSERLRDYHGWEAVVALDVIEHLDQAGGEMLVENARRALVPGRGVLVIGTPSAMFVHLASKPSREHHAYLYDHTSLYALLAERFHIVQSFGMQDTALHLGHPDARHYLLMAGIVPR